MALWIRGHLQTFCEYSSSTIYTSADTLAVSEDFSCSSSEATVVIREVFVACCSWELILFGSSTTVFTIELKVITISAALAVMELITSKLAEVYLVPVRFPLFTYKITIIYNNYTKFMKS